MKKVLSLVLALAMVLGSFGFTFAAAPATTVNEAGEILRDLEILEGYQGDLNLEGPLKRQDMIVLLSRLLGVEDEAKSFPLPTSFTDVKGDFYPPYIAWAQAQGLVEGMGNGLFGYDDQLTVKQLVTFLLRALGHEGQAAWDMADAAAADFTSAALNSQATRGVMAQATVAALYMEVAEGGMSLGTKLNLEGFELEDPTPEVPEKLEVVSVVTNNLKEVEVKFNQPVDKATAERIANYSLVEKPSYSVTIQQAELLEDGKTVVLTVEGNVENQTAHELTVRRAVAGDQVINNVKKEFNTLDVTLPAVVSVDALGTRAIRIEFSEPVASTLIGNYKINGNPVSASIERTGRVVILRPFVALNEGTHTIEVVNVTDYAGLRSLATSVEFDVVADNTPPAVASISATPETVTVKFTEPVQANTVKGGSSNGYWKATTATSVKNAAQTSVQQLSADTFRFSFSEANRLPLNEVFFYVEGVKDYSDNTIVVAPVAVTAKLDEVRPVVVEAEINEAKNAITVEYSKTMLDLGAGRLTNPARYSLVDKDGEEVSIRSITSNGARTIATINLFEALEEGEYRLTISGVNDATLLQNAVMPFETTITVGDVERPTIVASSKSGNIERQIFIQYSKPMTLVGEGSILRAENYFITYDGSLRTLPAGSNIALGDSAGRSVIITLPARINNANYNASLLSHVTVQRVEDLNENILAGFSVARDLNEVSTFELADVTNPVKLTETRTVTVEFNRAVDPGSVRATDFVVTGFVPGATPTTSGAIAVSSYSVEGNKVTLTLNDQVWGGVNVSVPAGAIQSVIGEDNVAISRAAKDEVRPTVAATTKVEGATNQFTIRFNEEVRVPAIPELFLNDIEVRVNGNKVAVEDLAIVGDYSASDFYSHTITVEINSTFTSTTNVSVELLNGRFVTDRGNNSATTFGRRAVIGGALSNN